MKNFLFILSILLFIQCQERQQIIVDVEKMSNVLVDLYTMQSIYEGLPSLSKDSIVANARKDILLRYQLSDSIFKLVLSQYNSNEKKMTSLENLIREKALQRIKEDSIKANLQGRRIKKDSLN